MTFEEWWRIWKSDNKLAGLRGTAEAAWDEAFAAGYQKRLDEESK